MGLKVMYEPKDPRIIFEEEYMSDDEDEGNEDDEKPRKRRTGTQALVEFLNTTSPEEFQKDVPKRVSGSFFKRRKSSSQQQQKNIQRKNYIEIIANPFMFSRPKKDPILPLRKGTNTNYNNNRLPTNNNNNPTSVISVPASFTKGASIVRRQPSLRMDASIRRSGSMAIDQSDLPALETDDVIEKGLRQRLEHYQHTGQEKPSNLIAKDVAQEHALALDIVLSMTRKEEEQEKKGPRQRHMQVQTMPMKWEGEEEEGKGQGEAMADVDSLPEQQLKNKLMQTEHALEQERSINARLEATLSELVDHYESLCGAAYSKLRQVWQEKVQWENACMQAKEQCWQQHHSQILKVQENMEI